MVSFDLGCQIVGAMEVDWMRWVRAKSLGRGVSYVLFTYFLTESEIVRGVPYWRMGAKVK